MPHLDTKAGGTASGARRRRDSTARRACIYGLGLVVCLSLPTSVRAQTAPASRDKKVTYFHEVPRGGHFAAWEQPELFAAELRAAFRPFQ